MTHIQVVMTKSRCRKDNLISCRCNGIEAMLPRSNEKLEAELGVRHLKIKTQVDTGTFPNKPFILLLKAQLMETLLRSCLSLILSPQDVPTSCIEGAVLLRFLTYFQ